MKKKWKKQGLIFLCLLAALLFGCGQAGNNADIKTAISEMDHIEEEDSTPDASELLLSKQEKWIETIPITDGNVKRVEISAEPKLPGAKHMSVLKLQPVHKTKETMEKIASAFDNGSLYIFDEEHPPKWYLDIKIKEYQEELDEFVAQHDGATSGVDEEGEAWSVENTIMTKMLREYRAVYDTAPEEGEIPTDYTENSYYGTINSIYYRVFIASDTEYGMWFTINPFENSEVVHYDGSGNLKNVFTTTERAGGENYASITEHLAGERAEALLASLGFEDFRTVDYQTANWERAGSDGERELFCEGYNIELTRNVDGVNIPPKKYETALSYHYHDSGQMNYLYETKSQDEYARVTVTDQGYTEIYICQPCKVEETLAKTTPLMNFSQLKEVILQQIEKHPQACGYGENDLVYFDTMELRYYTAIDAEGGKVILPVWELNAPWGKNEPKTAFMVNAIDGSFIDVLDERFIVDDFSGDTIPYDGDEDADLSGGGE